MKKTTLAMAAAVVVAISTGCAVQPNSAILAPLNMGTTTGEYYDPAVKSLKEGRATVKGYLIFTQGNASVKAAMANGGITKINRIERETKNVLCVYSEYTTVVYGE